MAEEIKQESSIPMSNIKFCKYCGQSIDMECIICTKCGKQVEEIKTEWPNVVINNSNSSANTNINANINGGFGNRAINKWVAFFLCIFLGFLGAHKFYEGKSGMGILYLLTFGFGGIGVVIDAITILLKPNPYYVHW